MPALRKTFVHLFIILSIVGLTAILRGSNTLLESAISVLKQISLGKWQETAAKVVQEMAGDLGDFTQLFWSCFVALSILGFIAALNQIWAWRSQETTAEVVQADAFGIKELASGTSPTVDIVAIHGLDGHRENSWTAKNGSGSGVLWLRDLLPTKVESARILTYGYDANTRGKEQLTNQTLYDHAATFVAKLVLYRERTSTMKRPIIFVAHSLGGIILKYALIQANSATRNHLAKHRAISLSTYGIIFLGTPHQGAENVDLALLLLQIQSIYSTTNDTVLKQLRRDSEFLQAQLSQYVSISGNFVTKFFFEAYPTLLPAGMKRMLVTRSSAVVPGAANVEAIAINKDHAGMAKFSSPDDDDFQTICGHLIHMVSMAPQKVAQTWRLERGHQGV